MISAMSHESPLIVAVGIRNEQLCKLIKCTDDYTNINADILICFRECPNAEASIIIKVINCNWTNPVSYGNVVLKSIKCCGNDCIKQVGGNITITSYIPKVYVTVMPEVLVRDLEALRNAILSNGVVNDLINRVLTERSTIGVSRTLIQLIKILRTGELPMDDLDREVLMMLEELGITSAGILIDKEKLNLLINEVIKYVYP